MIKTHKEPDGLGPCERCCFCRDKTAYWTKTDIAVCLDCAKIHIESELPTKREWCAKERALHKQAWD